MPTLSEISTETDTPETAVEWTTGKEIARDIAEMKLPELQMKLADAESLGHHDRILQLRTEIEISNRQLRGVFTAGDEVRIREEMEQAA